MIVIEGGAGKAEEQMGLAGVGRGPGSGDGRSRQRLPRDERTHGRILPGIYYADVRRRDIGRPAAGGGGLLRKTDRRRSRDRRDVSFLVRTTDRLGGQGARIYLCHTRPPRASCMRKGISLRFPRFLRESGRTKVSADAATAEVAERAARKAAGRAKV